MSYSIRLTDPVSGATIQLPTKHIMFGGTYQADYDEKSGTFSPSAHTDAWLNITYNYGHYYYEATDGDSRFAHNEVSAYYADGTTGPIKTEYGIRGIYGKMGAESINLLKDIIIRIEERYKVNGEWINTEREQVKYFDKVTGTELDFYKDILMKGRPESSYRREEYIETVNEGPNDDYWEATAANAIRPLYQLIAMANLRPDGVWDGD